MLVLIAAAAVAQGSSTVQPDFVKTWDTVSKAISSRYYARVSRKGEMDDLLAQYGPKAAASKTEAEFEHTVNEMIRQFGDSHFDFYTPSQQGYYLMQNLGADSANQDKMPEIGAWFKATESGYEVQMVLEGGEAAGAGLRKGDLMETADGQPFSPVDSLKPDVDKTVKLTFKRGGVEKSIQATVHQESGLGMFLDATKASERIIDAGGKKIGYMHLWTMASDDFRNAVSGAVYGKFANTDGMILDIRDGFGGRPEGFADPFFRPEVQLEWQYGPGLSRKELLGYQKPMVLLINRGSRSAKEVLAYIIKKSKRATLIGSQTAGNVLGTTPFRVNDWSYLEIPIVGLRVDGAVLEKNGVKPDIEVPEEMDANGKDLDIDRAVQLLQAK